MTIFRFVRARSRPGRAGVALAAGTVIAATLFAAPTATAHNVLVGSTPEDGSTITAQPGSIELVFDQAVQEQFAQVAILGADETAYETGEPVVDENTVTQAVGDLPDGDYTTSFRIVSADGHPVPGTVTFTMAAGESGADPSPTGEATTPDQPAEPSDQPAETTSACPTWPDCRDDATAAPAASASSDDGWVNPAVIVGGVAVAALLVVIGIAARRRRTMGGPRSAENPGLGETGTR